jgi:hypothetical protein
MTLPYQFKIVPGNPLDYERDDLVHLVESLSDVQDAEVSLVDVEGDAAYGVTFYEVIQVVSNVRGAGGDVALGYIIARIVKWQRDRRRREREQEPGVAPRPRSIVVLDEDGNKITEYNLRGDDEDHEQE